LRSLRKLERRSLDPSIIRLADLAHDPDLRDGSDPAVRAALTPPPEQPESASPPPPPPSPSAFVFTPLRDLLNEEIRPERWLWDGILTAGGLSLVVGKPKAGKSVLARNLAFSIAHGLPFLGRPTRQGVVCYLAFEESRRGVKRHFELMGADGTEPIHIHIGPRYGNDADDPGSLLLKIVTDYRPALIIVDTFARLFRIKDINRDYTAVARALETPMYIGREGRTQVLLTHHAKKGEGEGDDIDQVVGSTALAGSVDSIILLERHRNIRGGASVLKLIAHYGDGLSEPLALTLDEKRDIFTIEADNQSRIQAREDEKIAEILTFLRSRADYSATESEIHRSVTGRTETLSRLIRCAAVGGRINLSGTGRKGDPFVCRLNK
jgi:AAA domain